jgi:Asp-tRNA(Asn)/Glu-tRNA(Gln) amidotransferase B subunit
MTLILSVGQMDSADETKVEADKVLAEVKPGKQSAPVDRRKKIQMSGAQVTSKKSNLKLIHGTKNFQYQRELAKVGRLLKSYPASKNQLLELVTEQDPFKISGNEAKPHTVSEIVQNQMGALKVMALRGLVEGEQDSQVVENILESIISRAKDQTMVHISKAVLEARRQGRSLFKDFPDAIADMPLK